MARLDFSAEQFANVTSIDRDAWAAEMTLHAELFEQLKQGLPKQLVETKANIEARLAA
jgi:phosphoenolpyruvate carboxykinase (GTP)